MKKNAILIAGILCVASQAQDADRYKSASPSQSDTASPSTSTETLERDARQVPVPPSEPAPEPSESTLQDSSVGASPSTSSSTFDSSKSDADYVTDYSLEDDADNDISADSSVRGGSLDARNYDQDANDDELEGAPDPINPGKQADSSLRGGSITAREREWNHDSEPSSGRMDRKRHMKADSSIRGGSLEARGGREAMKDHEDLRSESYDHSTRYPIYDFGQGSSATWESDKASGSVQGSSSSTWDSSDDPQRDGLDVEAQSTWEYERDNDASVGGAARSETGSATLDDVELDYEATESADIQRDESAPVKEDLNSSEQLEKNLSGEIELDTQTPDLGASSLELDVDPNNLDTTDSSATSSRSSEIVHDESGVEISTDSDLSSDIEQENREAVGAAATSESGSESSSDDSDSSFESKDPALRSAETPLKENDIDFTYRDNPAHGVGSLSTGEFGAAAGAQSGIGFETDEQLSREVKGRLTQESAGNQSLMRSEVIRNVEVSANNGEVTLTGSVPTERDSQMIEIRTAAMPGVKSVKNELSVAPEADPGLRNLGRGHDLEDRTSDLQD
jgi:hypothetical protein